jgi:hypothetical protein
LDINIASSLGDDAQGVVDALTRQGTILEDTTALILRTLRTPTEGYGFRTPPYPLRTPTEGYGFRTPPYPYGFRTPPYPLHDLRDPLKPLNARSASAGINDVKGI